MPAAFPALDELSVTRITALPRVGIDERGAELLYLEGGQVRDGLACLREAQRSQEQDQRRQLGEDGLGRRLGRGRLAWRGR